MKSLDWCSVNVEKKQGVLVGRALKCSVVKGLVTVRAVDSFRGQKLPPPRLKEWRP